MKKRIIIEAVFVIFLAGVARGEVAEVGEPEYPPRNLEALCEEADVIALVRIETIRQPDRKAMQEGNAEPRIFSGAVAVGIKGVTTGERISFTQHVTGHAFYASSYFMNLETEKVYLLFLEKTDSEQFDAAWYEIFQTISFSDKVSEIFANRKTDEEALTKVIDVLMAGFEEQGEGWAGSFRLALRSEKFREMLRETAVGERCMRVLNEVKEKAGDWYTLGEVYAFQTDIFKKKPEVSEIIGYIMDPGQRVQDRKLALEWLGRYSDREEIRALRGIIAQCEEKEVLDRAKERLKSVAGDMSKLSDRTQAAIKMVFDGNTPAGTTSLVELIQGLDHRDRREPQKILRGALADDSVETRIRAATVLMGLKDGRGLDALIEEMATDDAAVRIRVARLLAGTDNYEVVAVMRKAVGDESAYIRALAIDFLSRKKDQGAFSEVLGHTEDKEAHGVADANVSASPGLAACKALGQLGRMEAAEALMAAVEDEDLSEAACEALGAITAKDYGHNIEDWRAWWAWQNLGDREIVVRVYEGGADGLVTKETHSITKGVVSFEEAMGRNASLIAVLAEDQNDVYIKRFLGDVSYAWDGTRVPEFFRLSRNDEVKRVIITRAVSDALGNPLAGAEVTLVTKTPDGRIFETGKTTTDGEGRFTDFFIEGTATRFLKFRHSEYGSALFSRSMAAGDIVLPLLAEGSEMARRSAWGVVADERGQPVSEALIAIQSISTAGGGNLSRLSSGTTVLTDGGGRFRIYPALKGGNVPAECDYVLVVSPPFQTGLSQQRVEVRNGQETVITLGQSEGRFRRFVFLNDTGEPVTDPAIRSSIRLMQDSGEVDRSRWINGGVFGPATYWATMELEGRAFGFVPVEVTAESGEQVVLVMKSGMTYYGRIVDGATGGPLSGVLVYGSRSGCFNVDLASVTDEQWGALARLWPNVVGDEPEVEPFKMFNDEILAATFTDEQGTYYLTMDSGASLHAIAFMRKDYLGIAVGPMPSAPPAETEVELPELKLYRAAKATVEAQYSEDCEVRFSKTLPNNEALEGREPYAVWNIRHETGYTIFNIGPNEFRSNTVQTFHIPADMDMCFSLNMFVGGDLASWRIPGVFRAAPGETIDLGSHVVGPGVNVYVRALDRRGAPVEGLAIKKYRTGFKDSGLIRVTDEEGVARFLVSRFKKGELGVHYDSEEEGVHLRETIPYEISGDEDEGREFLLVLSDEILYHLFK